MTYQISHEVHSLLHSSRTLRHTRHVVNLSTHPRERLSRWWREVVSQAKEMGEEDGGQESVTISDSDRQHISVWVLPETTAR